MSDSGSVDDRLLRLAEEFAGRYQRGEHPALTEYAERYPELAAQIRDLFPALVVMEEFGSVAGPGGGAGAGGALADGTAPARLGEYRILREVARGGMGIVYEAVQESLGRHVALKVLPFQSLARPGQLERFQREARAAARLHHTNIVPVFGVGTHAGVHYYAMQFIQGQGLDSVLHELRRLRRAKASPPREPAQDATVGGGPHGSGLSISIAQALLTGRFACEEASPLQPGPTPERVEAARGNGCGGSASTEAPSSHTDLAAQSEGQYFRSVARVGVQVAEALAHAHQQGILHRDIKPSNLLLDTQGTVWVTDFGLAKLASLGCEPGEADLTATGDVVGTLRYLAPERFAGRADPRSDVYSLGLTLYELLTLQPAFAAAERARLLSAKAGCSVNSSYSVAPRL